MKPMISSTDRTTVRIIVISIALLAAVGLLGTLYLLASGNTDSTVSVYVALAGVPLGGITALATTRSVTPPPTPPTTEPTPPAPPLPPTTDALLDEMATTDSPMGSSVLGRLGLGL